MASRAAYPMNILIYTAIRPEQPGTFGPAHNLIRTDRRLFGLAAEAPTSCGSMGRWCWSNLWHWSRGCTRNGTYRIMIPSRGKAV